MSSSEWNEQKVGENVHLGKKQHIVYTQLFPFLSFGQRLLKSSHHLVLNRESQIHMKQSKVFHDEKQCMFLLRLDQKGTIGKTDRNKHKRETECIMKKLIVFLSCFMLFTNSSEESHRSLSYSKIVLPSNQLFDFLIYLKGNPYQV